MSERGLRPCLLCWKLIWEQTSVPCHLNLFPVLTPNLFVWFWYKALVTAGSLKKMVCFGIQASICHPGAKDLQQVGSQDGTYFFSPFSAKPLWQHQSQISTLLLMVTSTVMLSRHIWFLAFFLAKRRKIGTGEIAWATSHPKREYYMAKRSLSLLPGQLQANSLKQLCFGWVFGISCSFCSGPWWNSCLIHIQIFKMWHQSK